MRVAALYDVHGVPSALEAVLAEVEREQVDSIVFGGDLFLGPQPAEIAALVRTVDASFVRGNCDREPDDWTRSKLDDETIAWSRGWPLTVEHAGHTHMQFKRDRWVNAGAVGWPYEDDVAAFWALVSDDVEFRRTPIDVERVASEMLASGWPDAETFVAENIRTPPSRAEATALFESRA